MGPRRPLTKVHDLDPHAVAATRSEGPEALARSRLGQMGLDRQGFRNLARKVGWHSEPVPVAAGVLDLKADHTVVFRDAGPPPFDLT